MAATTGASASSFCRASQASTTPPNSSTEKTSTACIAFTGDMTVESVDRISA